MSIARRKGSLAWTRDLSSTSLWRMPVDQPGRSPELLVNFSGSETDGELSSVGRIVFRSDWSSWDEISIARADGSGNQRQATRFQGPFVGDPHWSPDARTVAFTAHPNGNADIFTKSTLSCGRSSIV